MNQSTKFLLYLVFVLLVAGGVFYLLGAKAEEFVVSVTIASPPETIYSLLTEPEARMQWSDGLVACRRSGGDQGPVSEGSIYASELVINGARRAVEEIVRLVEPNQFLTLHREVDGIGETRIFQLEKSRDRTQLTYRVLQQRNFWASFLYLYNHRNLNGPMLQEIERLKKIAEQQASSR